MQAAVAFLCKETGSAWATYIQSASKLQESQSVCQQGPVRKPACIFTPFRQPAFIVTVRREVSGGEESTDFFRKPRKMTSLWTSPSRKPSVLQAGAHHNGLRDVKEARTSPLLSPESRRLAAPISYILRNVLVFCGIFWYISNIFRQKH